LPASTSSDQTGRLSPQLAPEPSPSPRRATARACFSVFGRGARGRAWRPGVLWRSWIRGERRPAIRRWARQKGREVSVENPQPRE
jgi:hypothetical protein